MSTVGTLLGAGSPTIPSKFPRPEKAAPSPADSVNQVQRASSVLKDATENETSKGDSHPGKHASRNRIDKDHASNGHTSRSIGNHVAVAVKGNTEEDPWDDW